MKRRTSIALDGLGIVESLRWHDGALWFSDLAHGTVNRWDTVASHEPEIVAAIPGRAGGLGWLADGRLLAVSIDERRVYRVESDGRPVVHADLSVRAGGMLNDMIVDPRGHAYVGNYGFDYDGFAEQHPNSKLYAPPGPPRAPIIHLDPEGVVVDASAPLMFPNGMVLTEDGETLIAAETIGMRLTAFDVQPMGGLTKPRSWASLVSPALWRTLTDGGIIGTVGRFAASVLDHPKLAERSNSPIAPEDITWHHDHNSIWVANGLRGECIHVSQGGPIIERVATSQKAFGCLVAGTDGRTLFVATNSGELPAIARAQRRGRVEVLRL